MMQMHERSAKPADPRKDINLLASPVDTNLEVWLPATDASSGSTVGMAGQPSLLVVVERRDFVRGCLTCWLGSACGEFETLAVAATESSVQDAALARAVVVLIGVDAPEQTDGWLGRQIGWLRANRPDLPIILIMEVDETDAAESLVARWEVQGCIPTSSSMKVAAAALRLVVAGGRYFPTTPDRSRSAAPPSGNATLAGRHFAKLTPREEEVMGVLGLGAQNKIIAYRLGMSLSTVKAHVHSIIRKLNVRNRTEAVVAARAAQALTPRINDHSSLAGPAAIGGPTNSSGVDIAYRMPANLSPALRL